MQLSIIFSCGCIEISLSIFFFVVLQNRHNGTKYFFILNETVSLKIISTYFYLEIYDASGRRCYICFLSALERMYNTFKNPIDLRKYLLENTLIDHRRSFAYVKIGDANLAV